ncbi:unnamed protein product [Closterium sp. Naga37s-1]|nr:unnamed protein product [Closterium sp. Naga37s-1]
MDEARAAIYLGIAANERAWRVWDLGDKCVVTSRDVVFDEDKFPSKEKPTQQLTFIFPPREEVEESETPPQVEKEADGGGANNEESIDDVVEVSPTEAATTSTPSSLPLALTRERREVRPPSKYNDYATVAVGETDKEGAAFCFATKEKVPPSARAQVPPSARAQVAPAARAQVSSSAGEKVPPAARTQVTPSPRAQITPSTQAQVPSSPREKVAPSARAQVAPSSRAQVASSPREKVAPSPEHKSPPPPEKKSPPPPEHKSPPPPKHKSPPPPKHKSPPPPEKKSPPPPEKKSPPPPEKKSPPPPSPSPPPPPPPPPPCKPSKKDHLIIILLKGAAVLVRKAHGILPPGNDAQKEDLWDVVTALGDAEVLINEGRRELVREQLDNSVATLEVGGELQGGWVQEQAAGGMIGLARVEIMKAQALFQE